MDNGFVLPAWAQKEIQRKEGLAKGLDRSEQMRQARGILTGAPVQSWIQQAAQADPRSWMQATASDGQGWQSIYGLSTAPATKTRGANPEPVAPGLTAPVAYGDPAERAREAEQRRMMQQYASKEYWGTEQGKAMLALGNQDRYTGQDLGGFYKAQGAVGIGSFDEVIGGLAQLDDRYKEGGDLRKWAEANKTLALREYMKRVPQGQAPDPSQGDIKTAMDQGKFYAPENSPNPLGERSQLVAGVDPGITMGPPAGVNGVLNRQQTAAIQATIPQAAATDTGTKAMNMQPSSAMAAGYQQPARPIAPGNMPDDVGAALDPNAVAVRELWKRKIQGAAQYQGG